MLGKMVLATSVAGALAVAAYLAPAVPTVLAAGPQLKSGLSGLADGTDRSNLVEVKKGGGKKGKGRGKGKSGGKSKGGGHGDGGKGKSKSHGDGGKSKGKSHGDEGKNKGKSAKHRDGDHKHHDKGRNHRHGDGHKTVIVYRDGHRYWHGRRILWWGPLVNYYDPCIRWVRFCRDCEREAINICYGDDY
jgi:hypothetical protein